MIKNICRMSVVALTVIYLAGSLAGWDLSILIFVSGFLVFISSLPFMGTTFRRTCLIFMLLGIGILAWFEQPFAVWIGGFNSMLNIVAILVVMQLFSIPIGVGGYDKAVELFLNRKIKTATTTYIFTMLVTHIFGSFLLFGTIPVMMSLFGEALKRSISDYKRFLATAISRGYSLVVLWAPGGVNILLIMQTTDTTWTDICRQGVLLCLIGLAISYLIEYRRISKDKLLNIGVSAEIVNNGQALPDKEVFKRLADILLVVAGLIMMMVFLEKIMFANLSARVIITGLTVFSLWMIKLLLHKHKETEKTNFKKGFSNYWHNGLLKTMDLAALFIAMGIFSKSIEISGLFVLFEPYLVTIAAGLGKLFVGVIPVIIVGCSLVGIHPFISIVLVGNLIMSISLPISAIDVALGLLLGSVVSYAGTPYAGIVLTMAKFIDTSPVKISLRWNILYCGCFLIAGTMFILFYSL